MTQLTMPKIEEDIMATVIRQHHLLFDALIRDLEREALSVNNTIERIRLIERGLRRLSVAA